MDYKNSFITTAGHIRILQALTTEITNWWTKDFRGNAENIDDQFIVRFGKTFKVFVVTEVSSDRISWTCKNAFIDLPHLDKKNEWKGTTVKLDYYSV